MQDDRREESRSGRGGGGTLLGCTCTLRKPSPTSHLPLACLSQLPGRNLGDGMAGKDFQDQVPNLLIHKQLN